MSRRSALEGEYARWREKHGELKLDDLPNIMRDAGYAPSEAQLATYKREATGTSVDSEYFMACCDRTGYGDPSSDELTSVFESFDPEGTGYVSVVILRRIMLTMGEVFEAGEFTKILREFISNEKNAQISDEYVSYRAFIAWALER
eukprot:TRINITY_DN56122_c0_g1_i1.p1 TRINITY_DN56122_c0_g1~~TRINITY_DN56122_c0_g1_i1.p1  ORF type:complete len:146 (+),score=16.63 TRINITY_DN56122_c0_g1_i1:195-632(+)